METSQFIKTINALRKASKGAWYQWHGTVNDSSVSIKAFGTWLQVYRVDGINQITTMDNSVSNFNVELLAGIK
jgi:hypothetical protein